jgi:hypothetical protein
MFLDKGVPLRCENYLEVQCLESEYISVVHNAGGPGGPGNICTAPGLTRAWLIKVRCPDIE